MKARAWWWVALVGLWALPAAAQQRVAIDNLKGDKKGAIRAQLASVLCAQWECVPPSRISKKKKLNWPMVKRERLSGVLTGVLKTKNKKKKMGSLSLTLLGPQKKVIWRKSLTVVRNKLLPREIETVLEQGTDALKVAQAEAPPPIATSTTEPPPTTPSTDRPFFSENADAGTPPTGHQADAGTAVTEATPGGEPGPGATGEPGGTPAARSSTERVQPFIVAELAADLLFRYHAFTGLETNNLFGYRANGIVLPSVRAELYPLASVRGLAQGIGITGDVAFAVGLNSSLPDGTKFPTRSIRWGIGLKWAIRPLEGSGFNFGPELGYRSWSFEVLPGSAGTAIPELPPLVYQSMDLGLGFEVPLGSIAMLSAKASYLPVFSSAQLISSSIFPKGSNNGVSAEASIGFFLGTPLFELRLTGMFTQYNLHFDEVPAGATYRATGAVDRYLGAKLGLIFRY